MAKYPWPHKYEALEATGKRLAAVPRYARLMALLPAERFQRLSSPAATFWEVYTYAAQQPTEDTGVLHSGIRTSRASDIGVENPADFVGDPDVLDYQIRRAMDILGAVAFEMLPGAESDATSATEKLKRAVVKRMQKAKLRDCFGKQVKKEKLWRDLGAVFAMDAHDLKYFIFSSSDREIRWTDVTTQRFFAAYWACNWANQKDREIMRGWVLDPLTGADQDFEEFWSFVVEMPDAAPTAVNAKRWVKLLAPLYDGTLVDGEGLPIRSTELIYRSWERMKETTAGKTFRGEFGRLLDAGDADRWQVAAGLLAAPNGRSQFIPLCVGLQGAADTGDFVMGAPEGEDPWDGEGAMQSNPLHTVRLSPYRLHRCCVTNAEYELFDARHRRYREFASKAGDVARHPVVNVSWYDAWCFAQWVGQVEMDRHAHAVQLPSEAQWEYACRASRETPFSWGGDRSGDKIESAYCNFDGNYPWQTPGTDKARKGPYLERTVTVDGHGEANIEIEANPWGLYQLHGNVWEWCADWYGDYPKPGEMAVDPLGPKDGVSRVLRGGSWIYNGRGCRSGYRNGRRPAYRSRRHGFRLAAVPSRSQASPAASSSAQASPAE